MADDEDSLDCPKLFSVDVCRKSGYRVYAEWILADHACIPCDDDLLDDHEETLAILVSFEFAID